ncbi:MFS transporter [Celeribacter sp. PS-C1]|uniref:MFS transporter n=1 Tax=Celeribacter sp. PS-C1 TaxID=2820813 RepID=UPI001C666E71|nr:MFS transporter [Celeribacter sp. PS-C1]
MTLALTLVIAFTIASFSTVVIRAYDDAIEPELRQRMDLLGTMLRDDLQRTLELGIPIDAVAGFDEKVAETVADFPEIRRVKIVANNREVLLDLENGDAGGGLQNVLGAQTWTNTFSVLARSRIVAEIELSGDPRQIETRLLRALLDISVIALAIIFLGVEVILALAARNIWIPRLAVTGLLEEQRRGCFDKVIDVPSGGQMRRLAERLNDRALHLARLNSREKADPRRFEISLPLSGRLPMFLLALGTETTASFLPVMARNAERMAALPGAVAAALPLILYLLAAAVSAPLASRVITRVGPQKAFFCAVPPIITGLVVMSVSSELAGIAFGRMIVGAGYTLAAVSCSAYMLRAGEHGAAAETQASLNTALYGGVLAGSVIGGVIAFEVGYSAAILLGAATIICAWFAARWGLSGPAGAVRHSNRAAGVEKQSPLSFFLTVACLAVPMSAATAIVVWYLVPMTLSQQGYETTIIARIVMLYYLSAILIAPLAGYLSNAIGFNERLAAVMGAILAAVALLGAGFASLGPIFVVALLGFGHAILRAPLYALVVFYCGRKASWIAGYRFAERLGAIVAFVAIFFATPENSDPSLIFASLGILSLSGAVIFGMISSSRTKRRETPV